MAEEPKVIERPEQPYAAIRVSVPMARMGETVPPLIGEVARWLGERGVAPVAAPFFKYNVVDMERELEVEAGFPVGAPMTGDDRVTTGVLPAGRYASLTHVGDYSGLVEATARLLTWAAERGLRWDRAPSGDGERWGARLEFYETDPAELPDPRDWVTVLAFRLAD